MGYIYISVKSFTADKKKMNLVKKLTAESNNIASNAKVL